MSIAATCHQFQRYIVLGAAIIFILLGLYKYSPGYDWSPTLKQGDTTTDTRLQDPDHKYAFCVLLAPFAEFKRDDEIRDEDHYFIATRMLIYQLLHDPVTRTNTSIPFVVLVTDDVPQYKRDRLVSDGASVVKVEHITFDWMKPGRERWKHVMDKLRVFELTQFEKILLLDADHVVVKRLDAIFDDPAAAVFPNLGKAGAVLEDEGPQPSHYLMAANSGPFNPNHTYPTSRGNHLNAGFVVLQPSIAMFNHYMTVGAIEGRFPSSSPEQSLWNHVHDWQGNMPWKQVDLDWTVNTPNYGDFEHGIASFHEKYWACNRDLRLRDVLLKSRWKMEGYFDAQDVQRAMLKE